MSKPIIFLRAAPFEFDEAADWYEVRRSGRGGKFTAAIRAVLDKIGEQSDFYAEVCPNVRESPLLKFPYCLAYREESERIVILSVFHTSRDPAHWQKRT